MTDSTSHDVTIPLTTRQGQKVLEAIARFGRRSLTCAFFRVTSSSGVLIKGLGKMNLLIVLIRLSLELASSHVS